MKKHQISFDEAIERVKSCRRFVGPNRGFIAQLCLYEDMGWCIDRDYLGFRLFRLQISADQIQKAKILPQSCSDVIKPDPAKITVNPEPIVYRCKKCRKKERGSSKKKRKPVVLEREDFDAGPTNLDLVEPGLWLGNLTAATDLDNLESRKITHILTVDSCPLPRKITELSGITTKFIQVTDLPKEDLLSHFEEAYTFIQEGLKKGVVLVHW
ncbi:hypothetical protein J437_LFUL004332 [Ladona fulva]|uniref:protein-tyrosine-phosphatase n=1 Tax=Ladona fulva TaxID=123851 RepID=A0A8K0K5R0_LADFU|nr:hypothetical protein J437_LFUL004332 [Ladona fulva]